LFLLILCDLLLVRMILFISLVLRLKLAVLQQLQLKIYLLLDVLAYRYMVALYVWLEFNFWFLLRLLNLVEELKPLLFTNPTQKLN